MNKYIVELSSYTKDKKVHKVEAIDCDDAIKVVCKLEGIEYNPLNLPSCMVQRTDS